MRTKVDDVALSKLARKAVAAAVKRDELGVLRAASAAYTWGPTDLYRLCALVGDKAAGTLSIQHCKPLGDGWVLDMGPDLRGPQRFAQRFLLASVQLWEAERLRLWNEQCQFAMVAQGPAWAVGPDRLLVHCALAMVALGGQVFRATGRQL